MVFHESSPVKRINLTNLSKKRSRDCHGTALLFFSSSSSAVRTGQTYALDRLPMVNTAYGQKQVDLFGNDVLV
jgi:hypothetical protein